MKTPFTTEQFYSVFERYNTAIFPFQLVIILLGVVALLLIHAHHSLKSKLVGSFLGLLWIWMGLIYHIIFFTTITKLAFVFGAAFIIQGLLILMNTFSNDKLFFNSFAQTKDYTAYFFILFALIIYPVIGYFLQGSLTRTISLGLPCPSTIFTFGCFMMMGTNFPKYLLAIPSVWSIVGVAAAIQFGVYQDFEMPIAAIIADIILLKTRI